ncbi:MAG TPA: hypothetical protein VEO01_05105 [Pseudonocardiaceae bacterium]|nr:hypothetical protein [Pseudonocardiaceae bacterium]
MNNGHGLRNLVLTVLGLIVVGALAWWLIKALIGLLLYAIVGALLVGGGLYLYGKAKRSIGR